MKVRAPIVSFVVPGPPVAWSRSGGKAFIGGDGKAHARRFTRPELRSYKAVVQHHALEAFKACNVGPFTGPVRVNMTFKFPCPKSAHRKRTPVPEQWSTNAKDIDNCCKSIMDALNGVAYEDDRQVTWLQAVKRRAAQDDVPAVYVHISEVTDDD